jgi:hypothetical protein
MGARRPSCSTHFDLSLTALTVFFRVAVAPDRSWPSPSPSGSAPACNNGTGHGIETGLIRQLPNGGFVEVTRPADERPAVSSGGPSTAVDLRNTVT